MVSSCCSAKTGPAAFGRNLTSIRLTCAQLSVDEFEIGPRENRGDDRGRPLLARARHDLEGVAHEVHVMPTTDWR